HNLLWYRHGSREHLHYNYYTGGDSNVAMSQYYLAKSDTYGDKLYFTDRLPWNAVSFGGYFINNKFNSLLEFYNPTQQVVSNITGAPLTINGAPVYGSLGIPNGDSHSSYMYMTDLAAFIQDDIQPVRNVRITPGLRVVTFNTNYVNNEAAQFPLNGYNNGVNTYGTSGITQPNSSTNFTDVEPSIGVNWQITPNVAVYANYSTAYKAPAGATGTYAHLLASSLKPQSSAQYQFGVKAYVPHDGLLNRASFGANYYHLNDTNEIIPIPVVSHLYREFASGSSTFSGVNLYFDDNPLYNLHVFTNLSFEKAVYS
ncbi:TonB-dependent receptor, partial [Acidithiobacillus ferridurans]|nr:TonB-dependent receptor [Acidithiobacillus ferridurans]